MEGNVRSLTRNELDKGRGIDDGGCGTKEYEETAVPWCRQLLTCPSPPRDHRRDRRDKNKPRPRPCPCPVLVLVCSVRCSLCSPLLSSATYCCWTITARNHSIYIYILRRLDCTLAASPLNYFLLLTYHWQHPVPTTHYPPNIYTPIYIYTRSFSWPSAPPSQSLSTPHSLAPSTLARSHNAHPPQSAPPFLSSLSSLSSF